MSEPSVNEAPLEAFSADVFQECGIYRGDAKTLS
jgi:hypothetical protein